MKKVFTEPEVEILNFLCDGLVDSTNTGGGSVSGGDAGDLLP